jgi:hypothetical protein
MMVIGEQGVVLYGGDAIPIYYIIGLLIVLRIEQMPGIRGASPVTRRKALIPDRLSLRDAGQFQTVVRRIRGSHTDTRRIIPYRSF